VTGLLVSGGSVVGPGGLRRADVTAVDGRIAAVGTTTPIGAAGRHLDATGLLVAPGFIDLQCNGVGGIDLTGDPERLWEVAALLPRWGVTSWLPTIVTSTAGARIRAMAAWRDRPPDVAGKALAQPLGLHLEGPFLHPARRGAHAERLLAAPDPDGAARWSADAGVALVTLAPELSGALDLVGDLTARGIVVAAGHSTATAAQAKAAIDRGVRFVTHLFNAMEPLHHREPGLVGVALDDPRVRVGLIADGIHVDPLVVRLAQRLLGERLVLVTDAVAALGVPRGALALGVVGITAGDDGVRRSDGTLAGSTLSLDRAVRNLATFSGCPVEDAIGAATTAPASVLGLGGHKGVVARGADADLVLLTPDLEHVATVVAGEVAVDRREGAP
jgi:N-acetylglucosamine-6-phosphate deacetylase